MWLPQRQKFSKRAPSCWSGSPAVRLSATVGTSATVAALRRYQDQASAHARSSRR